MMPDREKVIKGLSELEGFLFSEYGKVSANEANIWYDRFLAVNDALALLKEQEAVEPTRVNTNYEQHWNCGNCNAVISLQDKFCHECGQAVKWE